MAWLKTPCQEGTLSGDQLLVYILVNDPYIGNQCINYYFHVLNRKFKYKEIVLFVLMLFVCYPCMANCQTVRSKMKGDARSQTLISYRFRLRPVGTQKNWYAEWHLNLSCSVSWLAKPCIYKLLSFLIA